MDRASAYFTYDNLYSNYGVSKDEVKSLLSDYIASFDGNGVWLYTYDADDNGLPEFVDQILFGNGIVLNPSQDFVVD